MNSTIRQVPFWNLQVFFMMRNIFGLLIVILEPVIIFLDDSCWTSVFRFHYLMQWLNSRSFGNIFNTVNYQKINDNLSNVFKYSQQSKTINTLYNIFSYNQSIIEITEESIWLKFAYSNKRKQRGIQGINRMSKYKYDSSSQNPNHR